MSAGAVQNHKNLAEKLADCMHHIKSVGFRSFPDFMKQLFVEFPKGRGGASDGPHQTVTQTLRKFSEWGSLKPVLDGIAMNMSEKDENRDGLIPDYCISPDIAIAPGRYHHTLVSMLKISPEHKMTTQRNFETPQSVTELSYGLHYRSSSRRLTKKSVP
jgi:hypothetical protein